MMIRAHGTRRADDKFAFFYDESQLAGQVNAEVGIEEGFVVDRFVACAHGFKEQRQVCAA